MFTSCSVQVSARLAGEYPLAQLKLVHTPVRMDPRSCQVHKSTVTTSPRVGSVFSTGVESAGEVVEVTVISDTVARMLSDE